MQRNLGVAGGLTLVPSHGIQIPLPTSRKTCCWRQSSGGGRRICSCGRVDTEISISTAHIVGGVYYTPSPSTMNIECRMFTTPWVEIVNRARFLTPAAKRRLERKAYVVALVSIFALVPTSVICRDALPSCGGTEGTARHFRPGADIISREVVIY